MNLIFGEVFFGKYWGAHTGVVGVVRVHLALLVALS